MKRSMIRIDEDKCTGCGLCVTGCPEGALQIVDGKARLVGEVLCDGLGACVGDCPEGAISVEEREAEPYDERLVIDGILKQGPAVLKAHLNHLRSHGQVDYLAVAEDELRKRGLWNGELAGQSDCGCGGHGHDAGSAKHAAHEPSGHVSVPAVGHVPAGHGGHGGHHGLGGHGGGGCPGAANRVFARAPMGVEAATASAESALTHWPVQLHLMSPTAPQYRGADVLLAADCVAFASGEFHGRFLKGRALAIACPKLDSGMDEYERKIKALIDDARINTLTVAVMEVPCCRGLLRLAMTAAQSASRKVPIKVVVVGVSGEVMAEEWQ